MIRKLPFLNYRKIARISPSQFTAMRDCSYKSILAEALARGTLLPVSASASYGTVLHKMLELISVGSIRSSVEFEEAFAIQISKMEANLIALGWHMLVPLYQHVKDFTMKKIMVRDQVISIPYNNFSVPTRQNSSEEWLVSSDGLIGGLIDMISVYQNYVEIIDFKTGSITEPDIANCGNLALKTAYTDQLKLYAFLYFDKNGRFPDRLSLVDVARQKYEVKFSPEECIAIFAEAKTLLTDANREVELGIFSANPNEKNCQYCLNRPACKFYVVGSIAEQPLAEVSGIISKVFTSNRGYVNLILDALDDEISITYLPLDDFDDLKKGLGRQVNIFNLKRRSTHRAFKAIGTTIIYGSPLH